MARTSRPGSAPTYVLRCPRISASSRTPPKATRTNFRPSARATDSPSEVLPTPGGPVSAITAPEPALRATAPAREVLDDPVLDLLEPVVVGVEHGPSSDHVGRVLGRDVPGQL